MTRIASEVDVALANWPKFTDCVADTTCKGRCAGSRWRRLASSSSNKVASMAVFTTKTKRRRSVGDAGRRLLQRLALGSLLGTTLLGCASDPELKYLGGDKELSYYKTAATTIDYPAVETQNSPEATYARRPRTVLDREKDEVWSVSLSEAIQLAIQNNSIVRSRSNLGAPSAILSAGDNSRSVYDPAIQETGVLFGGRGIASALAAFDANFTTKMLWGRDENPLNANKNASKPTLPKAVTEQARETGKFSSELSKQFGYGASLTLNHGVDYVGTNLSTQRVFPSGYEGSLSAVYRQPLWQGAGAEFTRIAGPIAQSFGGLSGVNQGVVIARINQDITLADFESSVLTMLKDVEDLYWELYVRYREYDTAVTNRNSALQSWREAHRILQAGGKPGFKPSDEAQARDFYFQSRSLTETSLSNVYSAEITLRRILGLSVNDGRMMRPSDEPTTAAFAPSWETSLTEALTQRVELRRQKWNIKSLELQLIAAQSLTNPRLDFISGYQVNGLGNDLLGHYNSPNQYSSLYGSMTNGNYTGWNLGFEFQMPLGFRAAHAQVRNIELRLAKSRDILQAQEIDISHEVAQDFQTLAVQYMTAQSNFNRYLAAKQRVELFRAEVDAGTKTFDVLLRALASQAEAEVSYFRSLVDYNKAITALHFHKGTLLPHDSVWLSESDWTPEAYRDALRHAWARTHAIDTSHLSTEPEEFVAQRGWSAQEFGPANATPSDSALPYETEVELPPRPAPPAEERQAK
jgi:outer membrane protein TolC